MEFIINAEGATYYLCLEFQQNMKGGRMDYEKKESDGKAGFEYCPGSSFGGQ